MKKSSSKKKTIWIIGGIIVIAGIVVAFLLSQTNPSSAEDTAPALQTSKVRTGDLVVSAAGSGSVLSSAQAELGFRTSGIVSAVYVSASQVVKKGDVLASLDNSAQQIAFTQADANLKALFSPSGIAAYQLELVEAEIAYNYALGMSYTLGYSIGDEDDITILKTAVIVAEVAVTDAEEKYNSFVETPDGDVNKARALAALAEARIDLDSAKLNLAYYESKPDALDSKTIQANLDLAKAQFSEAKTALEIVQSGDTASLSKTLGATDGTALDKLKMEYLTYENTRIALENTNLTAPFDGVVVNLNLVPGQSVNTNPVLTLTSMDKLQVKFYMDETDLAGLSIGNRTIYTFNAYPETSLEGEVTVIEQSLQTYDGSPVVVVWGTLPERPSFDLLVGMTVDVEIIAGEALNAIIIPVQALRELTQGSYAVFVVQPDGSLKLTPVTIGLRDFANAEVLSGLKAGDVISTGTVETK
jgi:RND family efflux transporter MFP subunit